MAHRNDSVYQINNTPGQPGTSRGEQIQALCQPEWNGWTELWKQFYDGTAYVWTSKCYLDEITPGSGFAGCKDKTGLAKCDFLLFVDGWGPTLRMCSLHKECVHTLLAKLYWMIAGVQTNM